MLTITRPQPSASLIALGVQTLFTTSHPAPKGIVVVRLAIHAGKRLIQAPECPFPAWVALYQAQMRSGEGCRRCGHPDGQHVCYFSKTTCLGCGCDSWRAPDLPLGAVVASCIVTGVVAVTEMGDPWHDSHITDCPHEGELPHQQGGLWLFGPNNLTHGTPTRIEDQRPYADFTPGRYAYLLSDVAPTDVRCPACWGTGERYADNGLRIVCICGDAGHCPPIPATGRPGLWRWEGP